MESNEKTVIIILAIVIALLLIAGVFIWIYYVVPGKRVKTGMELLSGQETNNRLSLTGNPAADRVARLFNTLMERLHDQTIRNREQNRLLNTLISVSPSGVVLMDFDGCISEINSAAMHFLRVDETDSIGCRLEALPGTVAREFAAAPKGKSIVKISESEIYLCRKLQLIDRGFPRNFLLIDSMAEELRRTEKEAYGKVVRVMAHEVNNTVGGLDSILSTLSEYNADDPIVAEAIASSRESCKRIGEFVNSYAEVVRLPEPKLVAVDLRDAISSLCPFLQSLVGERASVEILNGFRISDDIKGVVNDDVKAIDKLMVKADRILLERVLVNIVKNGAESMDSASPGKIWIRTEKYNGGAVIEIGNNGKPIPEEQKDKLFSPFYSTRPGGTGTGLALVSEILGRHGWHYSLGTDPDGATRFMIYTI